MLFPPLPCLSFWKVGPWTTVSLMRECSDDWEWAGRLLESISLHLKKQANITFHFIESKILVPLV